MIGVISGTKEQFERFIEDVTPGDQSSFVRLARVEDCRGKHFHQIVRVGTWSSLANCDSIYWEALNRSAAYLEGRK